MQARFEYQLTRDEHVVGVQALTSELAKLDKGVPSRLFASLATATAAMLIVTYFYPESFRGLIAAAFLILIGEMVLIPRRLRGVSGQSYDPAMADLLVELGEEGIQETASGRRRRWEWTAVRRLHDRGSAVVIELAGWDMVVLPSRLWPDDQAKSRFVEEFRARLPEKAEEERRRGPAVPPDANQMQMVAAIVVALLPLVLIAYLLPAYTERYGPLADRIGLAGGLGAVILLSGAAGYPLYRFTRRALPRLHARRPGTTSVLTQLLAVALPFYLAATCTGLV